MATETDKPPSKFTELSPAQRKFIRSLGDNDLATLMRVIRVFAMVQGWCRINRWLFLAVVSVLVALVHEIDSIKALLGIKH